MTKILRKLAPGVTKEIAWHYVNWKDEGKELIFLLIFILLSYLLLKMFSFWSKHVGIAVASITLTLLLAAYHIRQLKYGERTILVYMLQMIIVLLVFNLSFAYVYLSTPASFGQLADSNGVIQNLDGKTAIYFSLVSFTTLGFGDIYPLGDFRFLSVLQAFLGWITIAMLILGLNKYAEVGS